MCRYIHPPVITTACCWGRGEGRGGGVEWYKTDQTHNPTTHETLAWTSCDLYSDFKSADAAVIKTTPLSRRNALHLYRAFQPLHGAQSALQWPRVQPFTHTRRPAAAATGRKSIQQFRIQGTLPHVDGWRRDCKLFGSRLSRVFASCVIILYNYTLFHSMSDLSTRAQVVVVKLLNCEFDLKFLVIL